jgi:hypothetical protein
VAAASFLKHSYEASGAYRVMAALKASPGRQSHSDATLYMSLVILYTKYAGRRQNEFNVDAY